MQEEDTVFKFSGVLNHHEQKTDGGELITATSHEQMKVENNVSLLYNFVRNKPCNLKLQRERHILYLKKGLKELSQYHSCLDASRPWLIYWTLHALELLDVMIIGDEATNVIDFLTRCQNPDGGFGGGPMQMSHLAPTYAAVCALTIIGTDEAYEAINRKTLLVFLWRMRTDEGAFTMHDMGEVDIRGVYCAITVARITNVYSDQLFKDTAQWLIRCQTYEGGFSGSPGLEAHGGYTYCGLAALTLLRSQHLCQTEALLRWGVNRQMKFEGGFQGRTNKLVDGCYSFWQGGLFPILHSILNLEGDSGLSAERWMFNQEALQEYLLICCQHPNGGLIDKPGKSADFYHTCYTLSGLSISQHFALGSVHEKCIVGNKNNELVPVHILYNVGVDSAMAANQYFNRLDVPLLNGDHSDSI